MVINWFKFRHSNGQNNINSNRNYSSGQSSADTSPVLSDVIWNHVHSRIFAKHRSNCRTFLFFINKRSNDRESKREQLQTHYNNLKEDVLRHWLNQTIEATRTADSFHESLIPLYIKIIRSLKTPIHFHEFESHLIHNDNKYINSIFEDIAKREPAHNEKVSQFWNSIEHKIENAVINKDAGGCKIDKIIRYDGGNEPPMPNYLMRHTVLYYMNKAYSDTLDLDVRTLDDEKKIVQLHFNMTEIGRGDEESMNCLLKKFKALEPDLVDGLKALINEKNSLIELFNVEFKEKIKAMMANMAGGFFAGECDFESRLKHR